MKKISFISIFTSLLVHLLLILLVLTNSNEQFRVVQNEPEMSQTIKISIVESQDEANSNTSLKIKSSNSNIQKQVAGLSYKDLLGSSQKFLFNDLISQNTVQTTDSSSYDSKSYASIGTNKKIGDTVFLQIPPPAYPELLPLITKTTLHYLKCSKSRWVLTQFKDDILLAKMVHNLLSKVNFFNENNNTFLQTLDQIILSYAVQKNEDVKKNSFDFDISDGNKFNIRYTLPLEKDVLWSPTQKVGESKIKRKSGPEVDILGLALKTHFYFNPPPEPLEIRRLRQMQLETQKC